MLWCCRKATVGAGTGILDVVVLQESYRWCRDRNARCCGVAGYLQMVQGRAGMLHVVVLQESYRWHRDSNIRCGGVAEKAIDGAGTVTLDVVVLQKKP